MTPAQFIAQYMPQAQAVSNTTGIAPDIILGQAAYETGYGSSNSAVNGNNLFGISTNGVLNTYPNAAASFTDYANLMNSPRYTGFQNAGTPYDFASFINNAGYSTAPTAQYAAGVAGTTSTIDNVLGIASNGNASYNGPIANQPNNQPNNGQCSTFDFRCKLNTLGSSISHQLGRGALIIFALILIAGAVAMFALKQIEKNPEILAT